MDTKRLEQHQIEAAARIVDTPELALWGAMGSGKTLTTLGAIQAIFGLDDAVGGGIDIAIVVGPRAVVDEVWEQEAKAFGMDGVVTVSGTSKTRLALSKRRDIRVYCVGCDSIGRNAAKKSEGGAIRRTPEPTPYLSAIMDGRDPSRVMLVVDESTKIKNHTTARAKVLLSIPWGRVLLLTGTPMPKGAEDVFGQMYLLPSSRAVLGASFERFTRRWCKPNRVGATAHYQLADQSDFKAAVAPWLLELAGTSKNIIPSTTEVIKVDWKTARKSYDDATAEAAAIESQIALRAMWIQLMGLCCGGYYTRDIDGAPTGDHVITHTAKIDALDAIVKKHAGENILVVIQFAFQRAQIADRYPDAAFYDSAKAKDLMPAWQRGDIPMMVIHPASAGHGLNLQAGGHVIVFLCAPHLEHFLQTRARIIRRGQKEHVYEYIVLAGDSLEADYYDEILKRGIQQDRLWLADKIQNTQKLREREASEARMALAVAAMRDQTADIFDFGGVLSGQSPEIAPQSTHEAVVNDFNHFDW